MVQWKLIFVRMTQIFLYYGLCTATGRGGPQSLLGACSIVCREFGLGKQIQNPIISMYNRNSEMGQDKACGLVGKVKKPEFRADVICQRKTRVLIFPLNRGDVDFRVRDSVSLGIAWFTACPESVPALQKSEWTADSGSLSCSGEPWPDQAGVLAVKSSASGAVKR